jgi:hypothetical protein
MHQYAYIGHGKTIHAAGQLEAFGNNVDEQSKNITNSNQNIITPDGYGINLSIVIGLPYMKIRIPTDHEMDTLPPIILTSDNP